MERGWKYHLCAFRSGDGTRDNVFTPSSPRRRIRDGDCIEPMKHPSTATTPARFSRKGAVCRCHCSALGEGHYSEQGEPVTSAPTPAIDPTTVGRTGVQCTRRALPRFALTRLVTRLYARGVTRNP